MNVRVYVNIDKAIAVIPSMSLFSSLNLEKTASKTAEIYLKFIFFHSFQNRQKKSQSNSLQLL